jgi:phosphohistidine phosphatase SixA
MAAGSDKVDERIMLIRLTLVMLLLAVTGCVVADEPRAQPHIYVMRHLHTPAGASDPDLTQEGRRYAALLDDWFRRDPPNVIYSSTARRAQQTVERLARRLKLTPRLYDPGDTPGLVAALLKERGTILVVGHSNTVPDIVAALGGQRPAPLVHEDFADIWHISGSNRATTRTRLGG